MRKIIFIPLGIIYILFVIWLISRSDKVDSPASNPQGIRLPINIESEDGVRAAAVAGSFYPADAGRLGKELSLLLSNAKKSDFVGSPRILIVPHAGITYSGNVAAYGFKQLEGRKNLRVILLGSSHTSNFDYAAVDDNQYWETPLGKVEVDRDFVKNLVNGESILADKSVHLKEHSLEVELIFLQKAVENFRIVPIMLGQTSDELIGALAQKLAYNFDDNTILIVSSDLSHYPDWTTANNSDNQLIDSILRGSEKIFDQKLDEIKGKNLAGLETPACGKDAIKAALKIGELIGVRNFEKIKYGNSGDVTGDKSRVVGYASILGSSGDIKFALINADDDSKKDSVEIARKTLETYLSSGSVQDIKSESQFLLQPLGAFVTLTKNGQLRGCMGEFEPTKPLYKVIQETSISSATKDKRFTPVTFEELKDIRIEISVMTPRKKVADWQKIILGKEGIVLQKGMNAGTFLPQVATDNNWDLEKFLNELCSQKAGLEKDCYKDPATDIYSFEVDVFGED
jgi:hypothetical protein